LLSPPSRAWPYAALACVCLLWGTTYLGIRIALEALPPFYLIAIRYTISGGILLAAAALAGAALPSRHELLRTAACGVICIGIGNGFLAISELLIPTGFAAVIYTACPFWMAGIDAVLPGGRRPRASTLWGLAAGTGGVLLAVVPGATAQGIHGPVLAGFLLLQISIAGWSLAADIVQDSDLRRAVYDRCENQPGAPGSQILEAAIADAADDAGVLLLLRSQARQGKTVMGPLGTAIRHVAEGSRPSPYGAGSREMFSVGVPQLRKDLFALTNNDGVEARLAIAALNAIDEIRDDYGVAESEPAIRTSRLTARGRFCLCDSPPVIRAGEVHFVQALHESNPQKTAA